MTEPSAVKRSDMIAYCSYAIPVTALPASVVVLIPPFYAETLGLSLASVGLIFFLLRLADAITDPAMGWLLDRKPFKQTHRPWIILALPLFFIGIGLLFFPSKDLASPLYLAFAGILTYSAYTIGLVAHQAWGAALAHSQEDLSRLFGYREYAVIAGILGVFAAPAVVEFAGYESLESKVTASAVFMFATFLIFTFYCTRNTPDPETPATSQKPTPNYKQFLLSRDFILVCLTSMLQNLGLVTISVLSFFLASYAFDTGHQFGLGKIVYFLSAAAGMILWMRLSLTVGDRKTYMFAAGYACFAVCTLPLMIEFQTYLLFMIVMGFAFGAPPFLIRSLVGGFANRYEAQTGESVRGSAYAAATFFDKFGSGVAAGVALPLVGFLGFQPGESSAEGVNALISVTMMLPLTMFALIVVCVYLLKIETTDHVARAKNVGETT